MRRSAARLCTILVVLTGLSAIHAAPASAVVAGFAVQITELPARFTAGGGPETMTVVASQRDGERCVKVRWSMVMQVTGMRLDQVAVERVEDTGSFPLTVQSDDDTARLTDVRLDPGNLCPNRTVTARYEVAVAAGVTDGTVAFQAEAYDANERLLQRTTARRDVGSGQLRPTPTPTSSSSSPTPTPTESGDDEPVDGAASGAPVEAGADQAGPGVQRNTSLPVGQSSPSTTSGLAVVGLVIGGIFIFLGVGLLLRLRRRTESGAEPGGRFAAYRRRRYS
ncbi:MAG TPA: hypothetical protein VF755_15630 [Catenuloplanes sp.]